MNATQLLPTNNATQLLPTNNYAVAHEVNFTSKSSFFINNTGSFKIERTGLLRNSLEFVKTKSLTLNVGVFTNVTPTFNKNWNLTYYKKLKNGEFAKRESNVSLERIAVIDLIGYETCERLETEMIDELILKLENATNAIHNFYSLTKN